MYGELRSAQKIAESIGRARETAEIVSSFDLIRCIADAKDHSAFVEAKVVQKVFQSLRIFVNNELGNLNDLLHGMGDLMKPQALGIVLTFHGLETKAVQDFLRTHRHDFKILVDNQSSSTEELEMNVASRSGRLFMFHSK